MWTEREQRAPIVIGGGFIGVEMAENLIGRALSVTLVEAAPHILAPFDRDGCDNREGNGRKRGKSHIGRRSKELRGHRQPGSG